MNPQILKEAPARHPTRPTERRLAGIHGAAITYTLTPQGLSMVILRGGESKSALLEPHNALQLARDIQREFGGRA